MKRLNPKTTGFSGKAVFLRKDLTYLFSEEDTLPEGYEFGFDIPDEDGEYVAKTSLGTLYISYKSPGKWLTSTGSYGDFTFRSIITPREYGPKIDFTMVADILGDKESLLQGLYGTERFENPYSDYYLQPQFEYTHTEYGDLFINKNGSLAINKKTGKIEWLALLTDWETGELYLPAYPWSTYSLPVGINDRYVFGISEQNYGNTFLLETSTGRVIYTGNIYNDYGVDVDVWGSHVIPMRNKNQFLIISYELYDGSDAVAKILTIENDVLTFTDHPASSLVDPASLQPYLDISGTPYTQHIYLALDDGSYYFNRLMNNSTNAITKFSPENEVLWHVNYGSLVAEDMTMIEDTVNGGIIMLPIEDGGSSAVHISDDGNPTVISGLTFPAIFSEAAYSGVPDSEGRIYAAFYNSDSPTFASNGISFYYYDLSSNSFVNMSVFMPNVKFSGDLICPKITSDLSGTNYLPVVASLSTPYENMKIPAYLLYLSNGTLEIREFEHTAASIDETNLHIDKEGEIYAIYSGTDSGLMRLTDNEDEFMLKLPSNPGINLTAGNWYWDPEDDWFPGRFYNVYDTSVYGTSGYAMGNYIVTPRAIINISTRDITFLGQTSYEINKYDDDHIIYGSRVLNVNTGAITTLTLPSTPPSGLPMHQFKLNGGELIRVYNSSSVNTIYRQNGAVWDTVTTFPNSNIRFTYYIDYQDKLYHMVFSGVFGSVTCTVTEYDFNTSQQTLYDTQSVPNLPSPEYDAIIGLSSYTQDDFRFETLTHCVYEGTAHFANSYYYNAPNKEFGIIPFNFRDSYYSRPYSNSSGVLQNPMFRLGDLLFMTTASGALAAYAISDTISPY